VSTDYGRVGHWHFSLSSDGREWARGSPITRAATSIAMRAGGTAAPEADPPTNVSQTRKGELMTMTAILAGGTLARGARGDSVRAFQDALRTSGA
jgi:hypothetical protein